MLKQLATAAACLMAVASAEEHIQVKIRNGELISRAANLGGWLLSEMWMSFTSPLYKGVNESIGYTGEHAVMTFLGKEQGTKQFEEHWSTWITEKDIAEIAKAGLNTVRVSTGYWIINDEDDRDQSELAQTFPKGGLKYLDTLINEWAVKYNLAVMVSLHSHKGSQNGYDHSSPVKIGEQTWHKNPENAVSSFNYATFIAKRYKNSPAFLGLNIMNEPNWGTDYDMLLKYYEDAYKAIRADGNDCIIVTSPWLQDQGKEKMADFMNCPTHYNVWHEWHIYYKWGWEGVSKEDVLLGAANYSNKHFKPWTGNPIYLGEWSLATIDEVVMDAKELKNFADIQMKEAEKSPAGWAFWAWRHDEETKKDPSGWSMRQLLKQGILTIPTTDGKRTRGPKCTGWVKKSNTSDLTVGDVETKEGTAKPADTDAAKVPAKGSGVAATTLSAALIVACSGVLALVSL